MHIHFLGICGTFMAGLARLACEMGYEVTGSDKAFYPPMSDQLSSLGVKTYSGYEPSLWDEINPDLIIVGNVCSRGMPIIEAMLDKGLPYTSGPKWLGEAVLSNRYVLAVAGTHGKTTTTAMLVHILKKNGIDTGYLIGGVSKGLPNSSFLGDSNYFVIESDEYDCAYFDKRPKFIHYSPNTFVINNIEFDHADIYSDLDSIINQFHYGVRLVPPAGYIVLGKGDAVEKLKEKGIWSRCYDTQIGDFLLKGNIIFNKKEPYCSIPDNIIGGHNQQNAFHAALAALSVGVDISDAMMALESFAGVKRRLEKIAEINGISVYDDFAHHPTSINETLKTIKTKNEKGRVIAVLEPRSNTMKMGIFKDKLLTSLDHADMAYVYLPESLSWSFEPTANICVINSFDSLLEQLKLDLKANDQVVIMSNGDFLGIHQKLVTILSS